MRTQILLLALLAINLTAARHVRFALDFTGSQTKASDGKTWNNAMKAPGQVLTTKVNPVFGVDMESRFLIGTKADWVSTASYSNTTTFTESGSITFGTHLHNEHVLTFVSDSNGHIFPAPSNEKETSVATAAYKVTGGKGAFAGATGTIVASVVFRPGQQKSEQLNALVIGQFWVKP